MSHPLTIPNMTAGGNVSPARWIKANGTKNQAVQASDPADYLLGISDERTRWPVGNPADDGYCAIANEPLAWHGPFQAANLTLGGPLSTTFLPVTTDASGKGVVATLTTSSTLLFVGGLAMQAGVSGDKVPVWVLPAWALKTS